MGNLKSLKAKIKKIKRIDNNEDYNRRRWVPLMPFNKLPKQRCYFIGRCKLEHVRAYINEIYCRYNSLMHVVCTFECRNRKIFIVSPLKQIVKAFYDTQRTMRTIPLELDCSLE